MALEDLCVRHQIVFGLHELLYSYFLKENDKEKGRYLLNLRHDRSHLVTDLRSSDKNWKDRYFFLRGQAIFGERGPGEILIGWRATGENLVVFFVLLITKS